MRTLVISDLHLGAASGNDVLRRPELREQLIAALRAREIRRLVIAGDALELREVPVRSAASYAAELISAASAALGPRGEIVMLAGNHDHPLLERWQAARRMEDPISVTQLAERIEPAAAGPVVEALARYAEVAPLWFSYPGFWAREDVYVTHGHYLDLHSTVPTMERLASGAMSRFVAPVPERAGPDDYEAVLAPLYAWMYVIAQRASDRVSGAGRRGSTGTYRALTGGGRTLRRAALRAGFRGAVGTVNALGLGPVSAGLSPAALRRGSLTGMGEVVRRLGIEAEHVVFGHSHRHGPLPDDDPAEWRAPTGAYLHNTGSWVYQPQFLGPDPAHSPYRPGTGVLIADTGPPERVQLLDVTDHASLAPLKSSPPA